MFKRYRFYLVWIAFLAAGLVACGDNGNGGTPKDAAQGDGQAPPPPSDGAPVTPPDAPSGPPPDAFVASCEQVSGTELTTELIAGDDALDTPVFVTSPPGDPRLFVVEQCGIIKIIDNGQVLENPFLDISGASENPRVNCDGNEEGLLGMVFHPDYSSNGRFFIKYTEQSGGNNTRNNVVAEYLVSRDRQVADPTEKRIIVIPQPQENHNAGMMAFGPDGYLYIGTGDGGGGGDPQGNGQDVTALLGSMLRLDIDSGDPYAIPASNPYASSANGPDDPRPEIWAKGLRNPWRFSFDRDTGDLYIGDVGQGDWEEIDVEPAGATGGRNYGWNVWEGNHCYPDGTTGCDPTGMTMPVAEYEHLQFDGFRDRSVTGGYVYRGRCMLDIRGWYFYADYGSHRVRSFRYENGVAVDNRLLDVDFGRNIASFGEDASGEIYVVNINPDELRKIVVAPPTGTQKK